MKTFKINAEKPKFYPSTVVYFTLAHLIETKQIQEGCHWCISMYFASAYFDEK